MTRCVCPLAGWCETHGRRMSEVRHRQCRDEPGYYEAFAKGKPPAPEPAAPPKPRGLGDTLERVFKAVGLDRIAKAKERLSGKPCGCAGRRDKLNALFPYRGDSPPAEG